MDCDPWPGNTKASEGFDMGAEYSESLGDGSGAHAAYRGSLRERIVNASANPLTAP